MPYICPICVKPWRNTQDSIHCASCDEWIHHNNRNNCSRLTDTEFETHRNDETKPWKCDNCLAKTTSKSFYSLPFVHLDTDNLFDLTDVRRTGSDDLNIMTSDMVKEFYC